MITADRDIPYALLITLFLLKYSLSFDVMRAAGETRDEGMVPDKASVLRKAPIGKKTELLYFQHQREFEFIF